MGFEVLGIRIWVYGFWGLRFRVGSFEDLRIWWGLRFNFEKAVALLRETKVFSRIGFEVLGIRILAYGFGV